MKTERIHVRATKETKEFYRVLGGEDITKGLEIVREFVRDNADAFDNWHENKRRENMRAVKK